MSEDRAPYGSLPTEPPDQASTTRPWAEWTDDELADEAQTGRRGQGAVVESTRRLRMATQDFSHDSKRQGGKLIGLTWAIIALTVGLAVIAYQQLRLTEKQDELLSWRADFSATLNGDPLNPGSDRVIVRNTGQRAARDFNFVVRVDANSVRAFGGGDLIAACQTTDGEVVASGSFSGPLFPTRAAVLVTFELWGDGQPVEIEWQVVADDGAFPRPDDVNIIAVEHSGGRFGVLKALPRPEAAPRPQDLKVPFPSCSA